MKYMKLEDFEPGDKIRFNDKYLDTNGDTYSWRVRDKILTIRHIGYFDKFGTAEFTFEEDFNGTNLSWFFNKNLKDYINTYGVLPIEIIQLGEEK